MNLRNNTKRLSVQALNYISVTSLYYNFLRKTEYKGPANIATRVLFKKFHY